MNPQSDPKIDENRSKNKHRFLSPNGAQNRPRMELETTKQYNKKNVTNQDMFFAKNVTKFCRNGEESQIIAESQLLLQNFQKLFSFKDL